MSDSFGKRLKFVRMYRGLTQRQLGAAVGFDEDSCDIRIAQYETDKRNPKSNVVKKLAEVLDVPLTFLCRDTIKAELFAETFFWHTEGMLEEWRAMHKRMANKEISEFEYYEWKLNYLDKYM